MNKFIAIIAISLGLVMQAQADTLSIARQLISDGISEKSSTAAAAAKLDLSFGKGKQDLQTSTSEDITLTSLEVDEQSKRFDAFVLLDGVVSIEVTGKYNELVEVPTLTHKMTTSEIITAADIDYVEIDAKKAARGYILDEAELVGKSPARTLAANRPIMANQLKEPTLVEEKKSVTIFFRNKLIQMQDTGIAMDNGAKDDIVRVKNASSNIIVSGTVVGEALVEVTPQNAILASR